MAQGVFGVGFDDARPNARYTGMRAGSAERAEAAHPAFGGRAAPGRLEDGDGDFQFLVEVTWRRSSRRRSRRRWSREMAALQAPLTSSAGASATVFSTLKKRICGLAEGGDFLVGVVGLAERPSAMLDWPEASQTSPVSTSAISMVFLPAISKGEGPAGGSRPEGHLPAAEGVGGASESAGRGR